MKAFHKIFRWSDKTRHELFEYDGWYVYDSGGVVYLSHGCEHNNSGFPTSAEQCDMCHTCVPDEIVAISVLLTLEGPNNDYLVYC